jgi:hypothetical protein
MSTTTRQSNTAALATFIVRKAEIDDLLARLQAASAEHFNANPDEVHWGHAGTLGQVAAQLKNIAEFLNA